MKNKWIAFNKDLLQTYKDFDLKLYNGKIISSLNYLHSKEIKSYDDIGWIREKEDFNRFKELQKIYSVLNSFTAEIGNENSEMWKLFDNLDYIFQNDGEKREKLDKMHLKLERYIKEAKELIIKESKTYL